LGFPATVVGVPFDAVFCAAAGMELTIAIATIALRKRFSIRCVFLPDSGSQHISSVFSMRFSGGYSPPLPSVL
jgi:hypothetical protein